MLSLEVVPLPVSDIDAALAFYRDRLGFVLDVDYRPKSSFLVIQLTPPGSSCSIHLELSPGVDRLSGLALVTADLAATYDRWLSAGVAVGQIKHKEPLDTWSGGWGAGIDIGRRDYASVFELVDPDGNTWTVQERGYHPIH